MENELLNRLHPVILHIGIAHQHNDWNFKDVCSPFTRIYYTIGGQAQIQYPNQKIDLRTGYLYIIPAFTRHSYACRGDFFHFYAHVYNEDEDNVLEDWDLPVEAEALPGDRERFERLHTLYPGRELAEADPKSYDNQPTLMQNIRDNRRQELCVQMEARGIILCLFSRFFKNATYKGITRDERIEKVLHYIRNHPALTPSTEELAQLTCLSKSHFIRLFRQEMACTPLQYINEKKMEKAQSKLITDNTEIKEIAFQLGFEDPSYFNRLFKKITGTTPKAYRDFHRFIQE